MLRKKMHESFIARGVSGRIKAKSFTPEAGESYLNRNGQLYRCVQVLGPDRAVMENEKTGWQFIAHRLYLWPDGFIEWGCSTSGRFKEDGARGEL